MASESEQNVRGTLADIVALIRKCLDVLDVELTRRSNRATPTMPDEALLCPVLNAKAALDSLEAEANREKAEIEADALAVGGIVEAARHKPGNAAAMREALEALIAYWDWNGFDAMRESQLKDMARAALAAPPRNCDLFGGDQKMLNTAWFDWTASPSGHDAIGVAKMTFAGWLLAPAAERKGE